VHRAAWGAVLLNIFPVMEWIGLLFRVSWLAGWLAIGESASFPPIEFYELAKPDTSSRFILLVRAFNIPIFWCLYSNREALLRHHQ
jgi:uncharacterized membrane protein (DUF2068 family)